MTRIDEANRLAGCPSAEELTAYNLGKLPPDRLAAMDTHLAGCPRCEGVLGALPDEDSVLANLRCCWAGDADTTIEEPGCRELGARAQAIRVSSPTTLLSNHLAAATVFERPRLPRQFGPYLLLEEVGHGGMGVVYRAKQVPLNRVVAVKLIRSGGIASPGERARFRVEGEALARLRHPAVILVHDLGEYDEELYLATEFVEGGNLARKLDDGPLPEREAAELVRQVALGVQAAHEANVLHRDLKPANILLASAPASGGREPPDSSAQSGGSRPPLAEWTPKVSDFGLAKLLDAESGQTWSEAVLGTPTYMAPEQAAGRVRDIDVRTDVWALGAVLYECLTGQPPFKGATREETLEQVRKREPERPSQRKRGLATDLEAVCLKCLEKDPARRYASAGDLAGDLGRFLAGEPTRARPAGWLGRLRKSLRRHPWRSRAAAALLVVLVLVPVGLFLFHPDRSLWDIEARLKRGEEVTLIGDTGEPKWSHWLTGGRAARTARAADGAFSIHTTSLSLLQLVRDPRRRHYRLRAQVRHDESRDPGAVGIFFCGQRPGSPSGSFTFLQLTFNDIQSATPLSPVLLKVCLHAEQANVDPWHHEVGARARELFQPAGQGEKPWRTLTVEVTPQGVRGFWGEEKNEVGTWMLYAEAVQMADEALVLRRRVFPNDSIAAATQPELGSGGSLGLSVYNSTASFRRVVLEPLGAAE